MQIDIKGSSRIVFKFKHYVIKIPNFLVCHLHFLYGCYGNWSEREYYKRCKKISDKLHIELLSPSYFCSWFGLIQIQARCKERLEYLTEEEKDIFKDITTDIKCQNFGYYKGKLVCLDYV